MSLSLKIQKSMKNKNNKIIQCIIGKVFMMNLRQTNLTIVKVIRD